MRRSVRLYLKYAALGLRSSMEYKGAFVLTALGRAVVAFSGVWAVYFLFSGFSGIGSYRFGDVLLCFGIIGVSFSLAESVSKGFCTFSGTIRRGEFDRILLRPWSPVGQVLGTGIDPGRIGELIPAGIVLAWGMRESGVAWTGGRIAVLLLMLAGGTVLFMGLFMVGATICFFSVEDTGCMNIFTYGAREHGKYPMDVYGKRIMEICTFLVPYTLVQYYPLQFLLDRTRSLWCAAAPLGSCIFLAACYGFWRFGMKHYKSCGS